MPTQRNQSSQTPKKAAQSDQNQRRSAADNNRPASKRSETPRARKER